ncbi:MAG: anthranilate phosphoribosyltransferase [Gammaproteobacteria bacterium]|nr:MAG: anthranilate phosphoribosyltransferase [Gammaproteobacteria bacterium]
MDIQTAIRTVCERNDLGPEQMRAVMRIIMTGEATPAQIGGFLIGLRLKGETVDEISAAAEVMRELATHVDVSGPHVVDTCGTGGDGINTFNISTASAFVVAAAGGKVAKHGNRSVSSHSGSADVLEAVGVSLDLTPVQVAQCIDEVGVGFMFAPKHHGAMKHAIGPRREMGVRTIFNLLGPLTNPASAPHQLIGVFDGRWVEPLAQVLRRLGSAHVLVVHAEDGMDEISIESPTYVAELKAGVISTYTVSPDQFGLRQGKVADLAVKSAEESLSIIESALNDEDGPARDIVALNAGAAIYAADLADSFEAGTRTALQCIASGTARGKLQALVGLSRELAG